MEGSALYNPRAHATPRQLRALAEKRARAERILDLAKPDGGIICLSASVRAAASSFAAPTPTADRLADMLSGVPDPHPPEFMWGHMWFHSLIFETEVRANQILQKQPKIIEIQITVADFFGITVAEILSQRRDAVIVRPRQVAYYLSKHLTDKSFPEIGRRFNRDHTSALSGIRKIERLRKTDETLNAQLNLLAKKLGGVLA